MDNAAVNRFIQELVGGDNCHKPTPCHKPAPCHCKPKPLPCHVPTPCHCKPKPPPCHVPTPCHCKPKPPCPKLCPKPGPILKCCQVCPDLHPEPYPCKITRNCKKSCESRHANPSSCNRCIKALNKVIKSGNNNDEWHQK